MSENGAGTTTTLPDGRLVHCVNAYEVGFGWHEISTDPLLTSCFTFPPGAYFDVGANIGLFCIRLRDLAPGARIFAYEPMPAAFAALQGNAAALGDAVLPIRLALGAAPGEALFEYFPGVTALSTANPTVGRALAQGLRSLLSGAASDDVQAIIAKTGANERQGDPEFLDQLFQAETVTAKVGTLAEEAQRLGVDEIELLKIDTEGGERAVLDGVGPLWPRIRQLLVEVHGGAQERDGFAAELAERGYRVTSDDHPLAQGGAPVFHLYARRS
jgi:FkbM family methyltransferase